MKLAVASELIDHQRMDSLWNEFSAVSPEFAEPDCDCRPLAEWLIAQNVLTRWQVTKLVEGKYKGFFLGKYKLLDHLASGKTSSRYLAEDTRRTLRVEIIVCPPSKHTAYLVIPPDTLLDEDTDGP